ncbi:MAG: AAA family ATPase [Oscillospiraceae bacterium]|jgi:septum site-determining protein MinD|nr:AAA family ATPase [Oscillospiraceae bacterium]
MGKVIVVTSGKGGTGKTTAVAAISSCLAALGHRTLCVDCDAGLRNLDISLGMSDFTVADIADVTDGGMSVADAAHEHPLIPGLFFLSAPGFRSPEEIDHQAMARLFGEARKGFDYCLFDSPAGLGAGFALAVSGADMAILVATGDVSSLRDAQRTAETLRDRGMGELSLLINRLSRRGWGALLSTLDDVVDDVGARLIGVVREDSAVSLSANTDKPLILYEDRGAARDFLDAARRIAGEPLPIIPR